MSLAEQISSVLRDHPEVRLAYLFGSRAREEGTAGSDVDVAVLLDPASGPGLLDGLAEDLERAVRGPVDLADLALAPPLLLHEIVRDGIVLVSRDEAERAEFELAAIAAYLDTQHLRDIQVAYMRERRGAA